MYNLEPGLYNSHNELIYSWEKLIEDRYATIYIEKDKIVLDLFCYDDDGILVIPNKINELSERFLEDSKISTVYVHKNILEIDEIAFDNCPFLEEIHVEPENPNFCSEDGVLFNKNKTVLITYPEGKSGDYYMVPNTVRTIGRAAFSENEFLKKINLNNVEKIDSFAFYKCYKLNDVLMQNVKDISICAFLYCSSLKTVNLPINLKFLSEESFDENMNVQILYEGTKEQFERIESLELSGILKENVLYNQKITLDKLLRHNISLSKINKILKEYEDR